MTFQAGDKVRCVDENCEKPLVHGQQYTIAQATPVVVHVVGLEGQGFYAHHFVLVVPERQSLGVKWGEERWGR